MPISINQHRAALTRSIIAVASFDAPPQLGFSAFFPSITVPTLEVAVEVERFGQYIAVDVQRGRGSNRNNFSKNTEHLYTPPFFSEKFDFTSLQNYDVAFGSGNNGPSENQAQTLIQSAQKKVLAMKNKILRAIEKQRADICQTGIVTLHNGDSINFNRQANSMQVLNGAAMWSNLNTATPEQDLIAGGDFLRQQGLSAGSIITVVMGATAFSNFKSNAAILKEAAIFKQINRINIGMPQFDNISGFAFQGQYGGGDFLFNIWTYNAWYKDSDQNVVKYLGTNNVVMLPDDFEGVTSFGAVPMVMGDGDNKVVMPMEGDFVYQQIIDEELATWDFIVKSAPIAVPVSIDRIYSVETSH